MVEWEVEWVVEWVAEWVVEWGEWVEWAVDGVVGWVGVGVGWAAEDEERRTDAGLAEVNGHLA